MKAFVVIVLCLFCSFTTTMKAEIIDSSLFRTSLKELTDLGLPVVIIKTINEEMPSYELAVKEEPVEGKGGTGIVANKVPGSLSIYKNGQCIYHSGEFEDGKSGMKIKIRGNTSAANFPKKPYKIKLEKAADLLQRGNGDFDDKNWLLIKDDSMTVKIGLLINDLVGMQYTPSYRYVNLLLNESYMGVYMLCESVCRNEKCRINISKQGYLFEYDAYWWNNHKYIMSSFPIPWMHYTIKYPDEDKISVDRWSYLEKYIKKAEESLDDGTYPYYIDVNSFALWLLAHDILGTWDAGGSNFFISKYDNNESTRLTMQTLWDFDSIFQRKNEWSTTHLAGWFFYGKLFSNKNEDFIRAYKNSWLKLKDTIFKDVILSLDNYEQEEEYLALEKSHMINKKLWGLNTMNVHDNFVKAKKWFVERQLWMEEEMKKIKTDEGTGMSSQYNQKQMPAKIFDLNGRQITSQKRGLIIKNGIKIIGK